TTAGALSSADWTTFNNKQNALTTPVTGTGTNNYVAKFNATGSTIGDSLIYDNGTNVSIGTANPLAKFHVQSSGSTYSTPADSNVAGIYVYNSTSNSTSAHSFISLRTNTENGGNPFISWDIGDVIGWSAGIDNADSDSFKIANNWADLASNTRLRITQAGIVRMHYYTTNGFVKFSNADGTLSVDTNTYITGGFIGTTALQTASANQALTGITGITFVAQSSDSASITSTIDGTQTFFDFNLSDDNNNDEWRWRFTPSGQSVYNAMRLVPTTNTTSNLIVSGTISASNFSGSSSGTNTGDQTTITGNAGSATVLQTARNFTINGTAKSFDGSAAVSWTAAEIGLTSYLPLAGNATMTGGYTISNANNTYTSPDSTNVPVIYLYNSNSTSTSAHSILSLRTHTATGGNPFVSYDINGVIGWTTGIDNADGDSFKISNNWLDIGSSTALKISVTTLATTLYGALSGTSATFSTSLALTKNSNSGTAISITNTDAGSSAIAEYKLNTDSSGFAAFGKNSSTRDGAGIIDPSDTFIYSEKGNISIFNNFSSGAIRFAAGASSTAQFTIASTGAATFSSSVTAGGIIYSTSGGVDGTF
ncbi:MAG: beta strand repeat-containing protein, partial [Dolichospermum sp.]